MSERSQLVFVPEWTPSFEGWTVKLINRNLWRVAPEFDFDDLMQDAVYWFLYLKNKYPRVIDAAHFMRLFQVTFSRHITHLSNVRTAKRSTETLVVDDEIRLEELAGVADDTRSAEFALDMEIAPAPIKRLLERAYNATKPQTFRRRVSGVRETTDAYLQRLLGEECPELRQTLESWLGVSV